MTKNIIIAGLFGLLALTLTVGIIGAQTPPGNKPDAAAKTETVGTPAQVQVTRGLNQASSTVSNLEVSVPFTVTLTDPVTSAVLRELPIKATVNLAAVSNKSQGLELFMADGKTRLENAVKASRVWITDPIIEKWDVIADANGDVQSIPMQINAQVDVGTFYSERVRFEIEGQNYTTLDPFSTSVNDLFADIEANTLAAFSR
jgi:hypothetical protein